METRQGKRDYPPIGQSRIEIEIIIPRYWSLLTCISACTSAKTFVLLALHYCSNPNDGTQISIIHINVTNSSVRTTTRSIAGAAQCTLGKRNQRIDFRHESDVHDRYRDLGGLGLTTALELKLDAPLPAYANAEQPTPTNVHVRMARRV